MVTKVRPASYGSGEQTLAHWDRSDGQALRLRRCWYKRRAYLDLRLWYQDTGGEWRPSKRGIRLAEEMAAPLVELLTKVAEGEHGDD